MAFMNQVSRSFELNLAEEKKISCPYELITIKTTEFLVFMNKCRLKDTKL